MGTSDVENLVDAYQQRLPATLEPQQPGGCEPRAVDLPEIENGHGVKLRHPARSEGVRLHSCVR